MQEAAVVIENEPGKKEAKKNGYQCYIAPDFPELFYTVVDRLRYLGMT